MKQENNINGRDFREMFTAATNWLEKSASDVDALNVFPVPDGDTGTNMLLTMHSTIEEADRTPNGKISVVSQAMAKGALIGARGNSGVILSQIWCGLAQGFAGKDTFNGRDLANALSQAAEMAYKGLSNPVEGTIITVIKDAAAAAQGQAVKEENDVISVMEATVNAASESVANTPLLLPVLKEAGVVDAGGQGLYTLLEGALRYLNGEAELMQFRKPQMITSNIPLTPMVFTAPERVAIEEIPFGYCTEFMLKGQGLSPDKLRKRLKKKGESLIVVGDDNTIRVHIHTLEPGNVINYVTSLGTMHGVSIRNMDEQHQDFLEMQKQRAPATGVAIIAVVPGERLSEVFSSLGTTAVVPGGQTMNPSTKDLLQAAELSASDKVIILPNNKNIVLTAGQVQSLTTKSIKVVPSKTIPQGVAALLAFDYEADFETNVSIMTEALSSVKSIEVTRAVRSTRLNGLSIKKKQAIGFLDGALISVDDKMSDVVYEVMTKAELDKADVITIYYGDEAKEAEANEINETIAAKYPNLQVEVVNGGQPHYEYIISIE
ncbi:MAG TPA: DAK2 domain-containing protein [Dehalococcoidia bacterium]|nr:DAK2 domain-containing protein [Dehalococcoidia bacterium]